MIYEHYIISVSPIPESLNIITVVVAYVRLSVTKLTYSPIGFEFEKTGLDLLLYTNT